MAELLERRTETAKHFDLDESNRGEFHIYVAETHLCR